MKKPHNVRTAQSNLNHYLRTAEQMTEILDLNIKDDYKVSLERKVTLMEHRIKRLRQWIAAKKKRPPYFPKSAQTEKFIQMLEEGWSPRMCVRVAKLSECEFTYLKTTNERVMELIKKHQELRVKKMRFAQ